MKNPLQGVTHLLPGAAYPLHALAKAASMDRRTLERLFEREGIQCLRVARSVWVPLSELELKVPALWESIHTVEKLRSLFEEEGDDEGLRAGRAS
jgi:hypothetical protein